MAYIFHFYLAASLHGGMRPAAVNEDDGTARHATQHGTGGGVDGAERNTIREMSQNTSFPITLHYVTLTQGTLRQHASILGKKGR